MTNVATCRICGKRVAQDARVCPHCGQFSPAASSVANTLFGWFAGLGRNRRRHPPASQARSKRTTAP